MLYGRLELGVGHARLRVGDNARYAGLGPVEAAFIGALLSPHVTVTAGGSAFDGLTTHSYTRDVCADDFACGPETGATDVDHLALWFRSNVYPFAGGLHLDGGAGYAVSNTS